MKLFDIIFLLLGIFIISCIAYWDWTQLQSQKIEIISDCNEYWRAKIDLYCPVARPFDIPFYPDNMTNASSLQYPGSLNVYR